MRQLIALGAAGVAALVVDLPGSPVAAEPAPGLADRPTRADVCVIDLDGQRFVGCFDDEIDARAAALAAGVGSVDPADAGAVPAGGQLLAIHYEHHNGYGQSFQVWGSCNGGAVKLGPPWASMLSSTVPSACTVKHYTGAACDGPSQSAPPGVMTNLDPALNDNVRCLTYS
jgi:hypothetical protein